MKILILGGHGFVGRSVNKLLQEKNIEPIYIISRRDGVDLTNYKQMYEIFKKVSPGVILNLAAHGGSLHYVTEYAADVIHDNIQMSLNIYKAVKECCPNARIINPISNCSYPGDSSIQKEEEWLNGPVHDSVLSYGNYKRFLYVISKCYHMQYKIDTVNILIPNTYGPGDSTDPNKTHALNGMIIRMIKAKRNRDKEFEIWGTGKPVREWAYITDVAKMITTVIDYPEPIIYPVNCAQNKGYSIRESAEMIKEAIQFTGSLRFNTNYQDGAPIKILDDHRFRKLFPDFKFYDHKKGINETVKYYEKELS